MSPNDNELLTLYVHRNDNEALEQLIRRHSGMVFGVCQQLLWRREDAEDAFQAVFVLLSTKAKKLLRHESIGGWLHVTATRTALQLRRNLARKREIEMLEEPAKKKEPWEAITESREREVLHREIAKLPRKYREVIVLYHFEGKSRSQIAGLLDCTTVAVKALLSRARKTLRQRLVQRGISVSVLLGCCGMGGTTESAAHSVSELLIQSTLDHCQGVTPTASVGGGPEVVESLFTKDSFMTISLKSLAMAATCTAAACLVSLAAVAGGFPQDVQGGNDRDRTIVLDAPVAADEFVEVEIPAPAPEVEIPAPAPVAAEAPAQVPIDPAAVNAIRRGNDFLRRRAVLSSPVRATSTVSLPGIQIRTFKSNGKRFRYTKFKPKTETKEQEYHVSVPIEVNGVVKMETQKRKRTVNVIKMQQQDALLPTDSTLESADGKKLEHDEVANRFADKDVVMILLPESGKIPEDWKQIIRPDAVVLRSNEMATVTQPPNAWRYQAAPVGWPLQPNQPVAAPAPARPAKP